MKIEKFTDGPWVAYDVDEPYQDYTHIILSDTKGAVGYSPKESESFLGYTRFKEADAKLMATSPKMYNLLKKIKNDVLYKLSLVGPSEIDLIVMEIENEISATLKEARGEKQ